MDSTGGYAHVSHSKQWSNYNLDLSLITHITRMCVQYGEIESETKPARKTEQWGCNDVGKLRRGQTQLIRRDFDFFIDRKPFARLQ